MKINKKILRILSLVIFVVCSQNTLADEKCDMISSTKEKLACQVDNIKKSKIAKKYNEINEKKTLVDLFKFKKKD